MPLGPVIGHHREETSCGRYIEFVAAQKHVVVQSTGVIKDDSSLPTKGKMKGISLVLR